MTDIESAIKRILVKEVYVTVPEPQIQSDDSLRDVLGVDSLGFAELRAQCENEFRISISDDDFQPDNFASVSSVVRLVERLSSAR